jgi:hypothetical protein
MKTERITRTTIAAVQLLKIIGYQNIDVSTTIQLRQGGQFFNSQSELDSHNGSVDGD